MTSPLSNLDCRNIDYSIHYLGNRYGFTNQIFKWVGDVANDLGEAKANQMFMGVAGGAKGASTQMSAAKAMGDSVGGAGGGDKKPGAAETELGDQTSKEPK